MIDIQPVFCTYFKKIEHFRYKQEIYDTFVAFCVKQGEFCYQIENEKEKIASEGEIVICPPNLCFRRKIITPIELCMIKFKILKADTPINEKIKISNLLRWQEDLEHLQNCLFCNNLNEQPHFYHYCKDILYIALQEQGEKGRISLAKAYITKNYDSNFSIEKLSKELGYTTPYLIEKFKLCYGITPKNYLLQLRLQKAKELLFTTDMLSREIAYTLGFNDELYFIRFFKKQTGFTPKQFRARGL